MARRFASSAPPEPLTQVQKDLRKRLQEHAEAEGFNVPAQKAKTLAQEIREHNAARAERMAAAAGPAEFRPEPPSERDQFSMARRELLTACRNFDALIRRARTQDPDNPLTDYAAQFCRAVREFMTALLPGDSGDALDRMRTAIASLERLQRGMR